VHHPPGLPVLVCAALLLSAAAARGQTAADMERLLDTDAVTCAQAAWFVLAAVQEEPPRSPEAAFAMAMERGWLPKKSERDGGITLGGLSLLVMKALNLKGGLMYRLFPRGRYAYRELLSREFIQGRSYSTFTVSGERFLRILENVLAKQETG
jgi:hypothetical protein